MYGDEKLTILHLGSGGGGGEVRGGQYGNSWTYCSGGAGGGGFSLLCKSLIMLGKGGISSNGICGNNKHCSGSGSGGSIYITVKHQIKMDKESFIIAKGGPPCQVFNAEVSGCKWNCVVDPSSISRGGNGRIRIDIGSDQASKIVNYNIKPKPYIVTK